MDSLKIDEHILLILIFFITAVSARYVLGIIDRKDRDKDGNDNSR
jgi:hypothetical protein